MRILAPPLLQPSAPIPARTAGPPLVTRSAPPLRLPGEHFAAALLFWIAGAAALVGVAPEVAQGLFPLPAVAAVTHLFTLGWITTTIQGALYQFLPVALQTPIHSERLAHASFALYVPGLVVFLGALVAGRHALMLAGAVFFGAALLLFVGNMAATLKKAPERNVTWWALTGAIASLAATVALGSSLAGNLRWGHLGEERFLAVAVHLHVAVFGWVVLVVVGVAQRLLPMFLLSHATSERWGGMAVGAIGAGVALLLALHHGLTVFRLWLIAGLLAGGLLAFLVQAALFFRHRNRPSLDPGLRLAGVALGFLLLALAVAPAFLRSGADRPHVATAYVLALVLGLSLFVAGHYYRIIPFLVWFHRFGPLVGKRPVPRVADLYSGRLGNLAAGLLATGALGLVLATLLRAPQFARPPALLFAGGALLLAAQMYLISRQGPR